MNAEKKNLFLSAFIGVYRRLNFLAVLAMRTPPAHGEIRAGTPS
jgi:hypothetical protein